MGKIVRALSADGSALCSAVDTTDIVNEIHRIHGTSATASAAAGRLATAACIMGAPVSYTHLTLPTIRLV